ncbi:hypothetical protein ACJRO7_028710 [Eucalyptus globulus]|uniref:X8 domain-containing protein n=1 Tax=Eucalyptus globulus TaxID=34317 RepID=A0ABD3JW34_EUCGL
MERSRACLKLWILLHLLSLSIFFIHSDARRVTARSKGTAHPKNPALRSTKRIRVTRNLDLPSNDQPYVSSPLTLPPYDSLPPMPLPDLSPPFCIYPPSTPQPPASTTNPPPTGITPSPYVYIPPILPAQNPPPSPDVVIPGPPESFLSPPGPVVVPVPPAPGTGPSPTPPEINPPYNVPSIPISFPSPPSSVPSPGGGGIVPSPFLPPIVYPPPTVPPSPNSGSSIALWCVAKPSVPEPIIREAMNYACGSGAECASIEPNGSCFQPDTLFAHASYAFNSYWQRTKVAGGSCSFGGTAVLVTVDPSYDGCHFAYL